MGEETGPPCDDCGSPFKYMVPIQSTKSNREINAEIRASKKRKREERAKEIKLFFKNEWLKTITQTEENRQMEIINQQYFEQMAEKREKTRVRELEWNFKNGIEAMTMDIGYEGDDERTTKSQMSQSVRSIHRSKSEARKKYLKLCKKLNVFRL